MLQATTNHDVKIGQLMIIPVVRPTLCERLTLGQILKTGPLPIPYIQGKAKGKYCSKSYNQSGQK